MALVITTEAEALIDVETPPETTEVEKHDIQRFAVAVAWPNKPSPQYYDEEYGKKSRFGSIIAPPTFATSLKWLGPVLEKVNPTMGKYRVGMNGGNEYEMYLPIRPGDVLSGRGKLASLKENPRDDGGCMLIMTMEGNFVNQNGEKVLTARQTLLRIYGPDQVLK
ncbi:MAG: MaoC family dehydratase N-terminal domain-containing protein [Dehalococcoidia bacterium]